MKREIRAIRKNSKTHPFNLSSIPEVNENVPQTKELLTRKTERQKGRKFSITITTVDNLSQDEKKVRSDIEELKNILKEVEAIYSNDERNIVNHITQLTTFQNYLCEFFRIYQDTEYALSYGNLNMKKHCNQAFLKKLGKLKKEGAEFFKDIFKETKKELEETIKDLGGIIETIGEALNKVDTQISETRSQGISKFNDFSSIPTSLNKIQASLQDFQKKISIAQKYLPLLSDYADYVEPEPEPEPEENYLEFSSEVSRCFTMLSEGRKTYERDVHTLSKKYLENTLQKIQAFTETLSGQLPQKDKESLTEDMALLNQISVYLEHIQPSGFFQTVWNFFSLPYELDEVSITELKIKVSDLKQTLDHKLQPKKNDSFFSFLNFLNWNRVPTPGEQSKHVFQAKGGN